MASEMSKRTSRQAARWGAVLSTAVLSAAVLSLACQNSTASESRGQELRVQTPSAEPPKPSAPAEPPAAAVKPTTAPAALTEPTAGTSPAASPTPAAHARLVGSAPAAAPPAAAASPTADAPTAKPAAGKLAEGTAASSEAFSTWLQAPSPAKAGAPLQLEVVLAAKPPYHCNAEYPHKFKLNAAPGLSFPEETVKGMRVAPERSVLSVPVTATSAGKATISGTLSFSVCTDERCLVEKRDLTLALDVQP